MIKTNLETLIEVGVAGSINHPKAEANGSSFAATYDGKPVVSVCQASITYNVKVGDRAFNWSWGDHIMPGVAIRNTDGQANQALNLLACIGNEAFVVDCSLDGKDSKIKGAAGVVVGKNVCMDVVSIYFPKRVLERLCIGDRIQIKACGQGLRLQDYPNISIMNCSPQLFKAINPTEKSGRIRVPVTTIIPGKLMGSGIGKTNAYVSGCDVQSTSPEIVKEYKLENIRLGDLVAVADYDCTFGPRWQDGAITVGTVVHGSSSMSGHGPGLAILFTSSEGLIDPVITRRANIADLLGLS